MKSDSGASVSIWMATADLPRRTRLAEDVSADVCVVGGGIAGLTTAYLLCREGRSVVLLDDGVIGGGETGRTTAHLVSVIDDRFEELERLHGLEGSRLAAQSHAAAVDRIESIVAAEGIPCGFERLDGYLFQPPGSDPSELDGELSAIRRAGLQGERVARAPIAGFDTGPALRFPRQGQFHPLRYLAGLLAAIEASGGRVFTDTHAVSFAGGRPARVGTAGGPTVTAQALVVATNTPVNDRVLIHTKQHPYRTYVVGLRVPAGSVERALFWDTADPYHYVRLSQAEGGAGEVLIVGGEDHHTGQETETAEGRWGRIEAWARERFRSAGEVSFRWSGQVMEPVDSLAFIGRNPMDDDNVYIATGDSGNGMTHGTIAGMLITDLIQGRSNPWAELYDPSRITLRAAGDWVAEGVRSTRPYARWATPADVSEPAEIAPGEGGVVRRGLEPVAVYRDPSGRTIELSAVCRHLGCIVRWNPAEKTWDCPCHGSRFTSEGKVVNGPAREDLPPAKR